MSFLLKVRVLKFFILCRDPKDVVLLSKIQRLLDRYLPYAFCVFFATCSGFWVIFRRSHGLVSEILDENRHHKSLSPSFSKPWFQVDIFFRKWNIVCFGFFEILAFLFCSVDGFIGKRKINFGTSSGNGNTIFISSKTECFKTSWFA